MEKKGLERLYLAKGDTEESNIYVDTVPLPHHQYDGVRFLYKQFKKGKAGVILNDPSRYGKRVQTVLFLNAVSPMLSVPTLILCPEGREDMWMYLFRQWTNIGSDISVQHGHEYTKSMCLIGNFSQINLLSRREWGILVVDDNHVTREVLRAGLSAIYRIWITAIDMKRNLQTFSLIYKWLYPRERFSAEEYLTPRRRPSAMLSQSTRLDAFMEDIVIRRRDVAVPLETTQYMPDPPRVSRKNKDATGKKIKRSKPLPVYDDETSGESQEVRSKITPAATKNGEITVKNESFEDNIVKIEPKNNTDNNNDLNDKNILESDEQQYQVKEETKHESDQDHSNMNIDFDIQNKTNTDINLNENVDNQVLENDAVINTNSQNDSLNILNNCSIDSQNIVIKYDSDTPDLDDDIHDDIPVKRLKLGNEIIVPNNKNNEISASEDLFPMETEPSENAMNNPDIESDNVNTKNNKSNGQNNDNILKDTTDELKDEKETDLNCKKNELDKSNVKEEKTEPKLEGIELKMKQMEELAMKKFKGSFLDSIF